MFVVLFSFEKLIDNSEKLKYIPSMEKGIDVGNSKINSLVYLVKQQTCVVKSKITDKFYNNPFKWFLSFNSLIS
jgi:hypothetical protein